jgi:hypothetical protein
MARGIRSAQKLRNLKRILSEVPNRQKTWHLQDETLSTKSRPCRRNTLVAGNHLFVVGGMIEPLDFASMQAQQTNLIRD